MITPLGSVTSVGHLPVARSGEGSKMGSHIAVDTSLVFPCKGEISTWTIFGTDFSAIEFQVYRPVVGDQACHLSRARARARVCVCVCVCGCCTDINVCIAAHTRLCSLPTHLPTHFCHGGQPPSQWELVGSNPFYCAGSGRQVFTVPEGTRIQVEAGDCVGWRWKERDDFGRNRMACLSSGGPGRLLYTGAFADGDVPGAQVTFDKKSTNTVSIAAGLVPALGAADSASVPLDFPPSLLEKADMYTNGRNLVVVVPPDLVYKSEVWLGGSLRVRACGCVCVSGLVVLLRTAMYAFRIPSQ